MPPDWDGEVVDINNLPTSWVTTPESRPLTYAEMEQNAIMFTLFFAVTTFTDRDVPHNNGVVDGLGQQDADEYVWTPQAVAAVLGNITAESSINPSRWQNDAPPEDPDTSDAETGYGLVQWTPFSKYRIWATDNYNPDEWGGWQGNGYLETRRIIYEWENEIQWMPTEQFNFDFHAFAASDRDPGYLADAFLTNYERPADPDASRELRQAWAQFWFNRVTQAIYAGGKSTLWYWLYGFIFNKNFTGRWF